MSASSQSEIVLLKPDLYELLIWTRVLPGPGSRQLEYLRQNFAVFRLFGDISFAAPNELRLVLLPW